MILAPVLTTGAGALTVSVTPDFTSARVNASSGTTTESVTLNVDGEVGSITAVWVSDNLNIGMTSPASTTTSTFDFVGMIVLEPVYANITVTVTDSLGRTGFYVFGVTVTRLS